MKRKFFIIIFIFTALITFSYCQTVDTKQNSLPDAESKTCQLDLRLKFINTAMQYLKTPYKYASATNEGMDCSGLVYKTALEAFDCNLPRSAYEIAKVVTKVNDDKVQLGDLVFFNTGGSTISHVGIYIGDNQFIHSASAGPKTGVIISNLDELYWKQRFLFFGSLDFNIE